MVCDSTRAAGSQSDHATESQISRRGLIESALGLGTVALLAPTADLTARQRQAGTGPATSALPVRRGAAARTQVALLGTAGGPGVDPARAQTASAMVIDGIPYLIDCGYGALRQLVAAKVGYLQLSTLFFTHLHDDHTADLPALLTLQWTNGKTTATDAYGPFGTDRLVAAAVAFSRANVEIRTADEGRTVDPTRQFHGHDVHASAATVLVFRDDRVTVTAVENTHYPDRVKAKMPHRSLALRFDTADRSVVFSGDTAYSQNVARLAHNADLFVCEVVDSLLLQQMRERAHAAAAAGQPNNVFRHVADAHSSPADVARMATEAGVKTVVLNHQVGGQTESLAYPVTAFIEGVRSGFNGEVIVGQDLMVL